MIVEFVESAIRTFCGIGRSKPRSIMNLINYMIKTNNLLRDGTKSVDSGVTSENSPWFWIPFTKFEALT